MLDWMKGNEGTEAAGKIISSLIDASLITDRIDTSKVLEPPETPAPVFALRAFKSALFGTPGAEDDDKTPRPAQPKQAVHQRSRSETAKPMPIEKPDLKPDIDTAANPSGSPTKSILVTPGTISNRRKTVSFGEGVVDNEGKRESPSKSRTPQATGNLSAQWMSGSADGKRSKLTQSLMDARESSSNKADSSTAPNPSPKPATATRPASEDEAGMEDLTLNLDEPRSESGKYWKTEFDNYRMRTNREIKKLIHYRSVSKSYARKKDEEALRLVQKLKEEEERVAEMENQVSRLASSVAGGVSNNNSDQLIKDLTKQTALTLQYKQQAAGLRSMLEQQGVFEAHGSPNSNGVKKEETSPNPGPNKLQKPQPESKQTDTKLEELKQKNPDLARLQNLAQSSQQKAQELERENTSLKQTLARVKHEMSRYEGRRKEKETKLKQREAKLEGRIQEYRARLKATTQEHRQTEEELRNDFEAERRKMQSQIEQLKTRVMAVEHGPIFRPQQRHSLSPRKAYTGIQIHDFADQEPTVDIETTEDIEAPPSPSPRSKARETRQNRAATTSALDAKRASREIAADDDEVTHYLNAILPRHSARAQDLDEIPPSSPPDIAPLKSLNGFTRRNYAKQDEPIAIPSYRSIHRDPDTTDPAPANTHRPRAHIKSTLDSISGPQGYTISGERPKNPRAGLSDMKMTDLTPDRVAAARERLKMKTDSRRMKSRAFGKENVA